MVSSGHKVFRRVVWLFVSLGILVGTGRWAMLARIDELAFAGAKDKYGWRVRERGGYWGFGTPWLVAEINKKDFETWFAEGERRWLINDYGRSGSVRSFINNKSVKIGDDVRVYGLWYKNGETVKFCLTDETKDKYIVYFLIFLL